jgi:Polyketide cyclase / dehydrase and lipid transport
MASIRREIVIEASRESVWDAVADWGALDRRLAPGFVTDCRVEDRDRVVTFFNGSIVRERIVDCDHASHRLAWSIVDGPYEHHNGSAEVMADGASRARFVWTTDLLPDELADGTTQMMEQGLNAVARTLGKLSEVS